MNIEKFLNSRDRRDYSREFIANPMSPANREEINNWCAENTQHGVKCYQGMYNINRWQFCDDSDAMMFALRWGQYFTQN